MTNEGTEETEAQVLRRSLDNFGKIDIDQQLIRVAELGDASFTGYRPVFEQTINYITSISSLEWDLLPQEMIGQVQNQVQRLETQFAQVHDLPLEGNPKEARDQVAAQLETVFNNFRQATVPMIGFLSWKSVNLVEMQQQVQTVLTDATRRATEIEEEARKELDQRKEEAEKTLEAIRSASAEIGVGIHSKTFGDEANKHETLSRWWLAASLLAAVGTFVGAVILVWTWDVSGDVSEASNLQIILAKGVFLTLGFFVTINFFRIFRSHAHLEVTNRHREKSLQTFRSFVEATADEDTKHKVLLEATHAIFGHVGTGLVEDRETGVLGEILSTIMRRG